MSADFDAAAFRTWAAGNGGEDDSIAITIRLEDCGFIELVPCEGHDCGQYHATLTMDGLLAMITMLRGLHYEHPVIDYGIEGMIHILASDYMQRRTLEQAAVDEMFGEGLEP